LSARPHLAVETQSRNSSKRKQATVLESRNQGRKAKTFPEWKDKTLKSIGRRATAEQGKKIEKHGGKKIEKHGGKKIEEHGGKRIEKYGGKKIEKSGGKKIEEHGGRKIEEHGGKKIEEQGVKKIEKYGGKNQGVDLDTKEEREAEEEWTRSREKIRLSSRGRMLISEETKHYKTSKDGSRENKESVKNKTVKEQKSNTAAGLESHEPRGKVKKEFKIREVDAKRMIIYEDGEGKIQIHALL